MSSVTDLAVARAARAERAEQVVRVDPDPCAIARCSMPSCRESLYLEHTGTSVIQHAATVEDLADLDDDFITWAVVCTAGHKVLLPIDEQGGARFGECTCDGEPELLADCGHNDMARLRRVVA